jgi:uncharacterized SAM-binding protein YcdF (DUF218 family)
LQYASRVQFDVLVVLGCRVRDGNLLTAALRRIEQAAATYHEQGAALVVTSGGKTWQGWLESDVFARGLEERGVPRERLLQERRSLTTRGNAREVAQLLRGKSIGHLGIVTCEWHMPRALRLFEREGFRPNAVPAASPPAQAHVAWLRSARERASLRVDLLLSPFRSSSG